MANIVSRMGNRLPGRRSAPFQLQGKLLLGLLLQLLCMPLFAQQQAGEYEVKAVYLYNFANYVEWPDEVLAGNDAFVFVVAGAPDVAGHLRALAESRTVNGRPIEVRVIDGTAGVEGAHVLFIGEQFPRQNALLVGTASMPVLTVTEDPEQHPAESAINFTVTDDKVRFDIALMVAQRSGLRVSSRLLNVARRVLGLRKHEYLLIARVFSGSPFRS